MTSDRIIEGYHKFAKYLKLDKIDIKCDVLLYRKLPMDDAHLLDGFLGHAFVYYPRPRHRKYFVVDGGNSAYLSYKRLANSGVYLALFRSESIASPSSLCFLLNKRDKIGVE